MRCEGVEGGEMRCRDGGGGGSDVRGEDSRERETEDCQQKLSGDSREERWR